MNGEEIKASPFDLSIKRGVSPENLTLSGPGLEKAYKDQSNKFNIKVKDEYGSFYDLGL